MLVVVLFISVVLAQASVLPHQRKTYDGYALWQVIPATAEQLESLRSLEDNDQIIFWEEAHHIGQQTELLVHKDVAHMFQDHVITAGTPAIQIYSNIQTYLAREQSRLDARHSDGETYAYDKEDYNTYADIMLEMERLLTVCADAGLECEMYSIGESYEGRDIPAFKVSSDSSNQVIWIDSLIHAREWVAGTTNMRILDHLIEDYGTDETVTRMVDKYDWHILPVHNPDGYVYSWETDRFWRKSRNPNAGSSCIGTDLNRNFNYKWGGSGTSSNPCSAVYHGSSAGSEPETKAIQDEAMRLAPRTDVWFSFHTSAQAWLLPYGHLEGGRCVRPDDYDDLKEANDAAVDAVEKTNGLNYGAGNSCEELYSTTGTTADYVKGAAGVKYSLTPELRGPGFAPGPSAIFPAFTENWNGVVAFIDKMEEIEYRKH